MHDLEWRDEVPVGATSGRGDVGAGRRRGGATSVGSGRRWDSDCTCRISQPLTAGAAMHPQLLSVWNLLPPLHRLVTAAVTGDVRCLCLSAVQQEAVGQR